VRREGELKQSPRFVALEQHPGAARGRDAGGTPEPPATPERTMNPSQRAAVPVVLMPLAPEPSARASAAVLLGMLAVLAACSSSTPAVAPATEAGAVRDHREWRVALGDPTSSQFSSLTQINRDNVHLLEVAWIHHTGDLRDGQRTEIQANPIIIDGVLYATSPALRAFALRADTGEPIWSFDPFDGVDPVLHANRGVVYWADAEDRRILYTAGPRLWALDARTGRPIPGFGNGGWVSLNDGLERRLFGDVIATSPGTVFRDLLILGHRVADNERAHPGHIRAFDVRTGRIRWAFRTIPHPGEEGYETWSPDTYLTSGGANSWAGMSLDVARGVVFVPTGTGAHDFWGGKRIGRNRFANSVIALDAATGRRIWDFQTVRHDVWDRDLPAPPNLVTVTRNGRRIEAVAQVTKSGHVWLLDRATGEPLFPHREFEVPASDLRGEQTWPTQILPIVPAPFSRQTLTEADLTDRTPEARAAVLAEFRRYRSGGQFIPASVQGTILFPGYDGGAEWGGAAFDPETGILYVNANDVPWILRMEERAVAAAPVAGGSGREVYLANCAACHGAERQGDGGRSPALTDLGHRTSAEEIRRIVQNGRGFMPASPQIRGEAMSALVAYLLGTAPAPSAGGVGTGPADDWWSAPYRHAGYPRWTDPDGYPAVRPPWGTLNAIDLNTGEYVWRVPFGEYPELTARGMPVTGTENYGGPVVTAGGLLFIGATRDEKFRVFDKASGRVLWEFALPAAGYATPATYEVGGKQYVVIAAGGGKLGTRSGDAFIAFALPDRAASGVNEPAAQTVVAARRRCRRIAASGYADAPGAGPGADIGCSVSGARGTAIAAPTPPGRVTTRTPVRGGTRHSGGGP
jgi:quinoprotein glucose dehydrogenase